MQLYPTKKITEYLMHHLFKTVFTLGIFTWSIYVCFFREISLEQSYLGIGKEVIFRFICIIAIIITPAKFIKSIVIVICTALDLIFRSEKEYIIHGFVRKNGKLAFGDQYMIINTVFGKNMFIKARCHKEVCKTTDERAEQRKSITDENLRWIFFLLHPPKFASEETKKMIT